VRATLRERLFSWFGKKKGATPLVSASRDRDLLKRIHGQKFPRPTQLIHVTKILSPRERQLFRWSLFVCIVGLVWVGWDFLGKYRVETAAPGGQYIEAIVGSPQLINPLFASMNDADNDVTKVVFSGLMKYSSTQELLPDLAERYEVSDDKKTYTFYLRKNAVWHDNEPVTAHDIAFTIERIQNSAVGSPLSVSFQGVNVQVVDEATVRFTLKEPFAPFLASLTVGIIPEHLWFDVLPERMRLAHLNLQPIGTGPFLFKRLVKRDDGTIDRLEFKRFDKYYDQPAYLEEFAFRFYPDYKGETGAIQALREQDVQGLSFVPYDLRDRIERKHITVHTLQLPQYTALFFNLNGTRSVGDADVRKALSLALDKERVLRESVKNEGQVIESMVLPGFPGYKEVEKARYSTEEANAILDKKWTRVGADEYRSMRKEELLKAFKENNPVTTSTPDATSTDLLAQAEAEIQKQLDEELYAAQTFYRKTKDGNVLTVSLVTADTPEYRQAAKLIAGFWQEIGVHTTIKTVAPKDFSRDVLKDRAYDVLLYGVILGSDPDQYAFWHSSQVGYPGLNLSGYTNRTVDGLLTKARESSNPEDIAKAYTDVQQEIAKDIPAIFLYMPTYTYATTDKIKGLDIHRIFHPSDRLGDVATWYIKTNGEWKRS